MLLLALTACAFVVMLIFFVFSKYFIAGKSKFLYILPVLVSAGFMVLLLGHLKISNFYPSMQEYEGIIIDKQYFRGTLSILVSGNKDKGWHYIMNANVFRRMHYGDYIIKKKGEEVYRWVHYYGSADTVVFR